jgi:hypothetical protein
MTNFPQPDDELHRPTDPAQLGADQGPGTSAEDDSRDMTPVLATAADEPGGASSRRQTSGTGTGDSSSATGLGSAFDEQRRAGANGDGNNAGTVGSGLGMGRAGFNGDHDRGYDQSGHRGGLGTSGGREDLSNRQMNADSNPFTGGYGGGDYPQPDASQTQHIGMHSRNPTDESGAHPGEAPSKTETEQ